MSVVYKTDGHTSTSTLFNASHFLKLFTDLWFIDKNLLADTDRYAASHTHLLCSVLFCFVCLPFFLSTTESLLLHAAATASHTHLLCSVLFCLPIYLTILSFYNRVIIVTCCSDCCSYESQHSTGSQTRARQIPFRDCWRSRERYCRYVHRLKYTIF